MHSGSLGIMRYVRIFADENGTSAFAEFGPGSLLSFEDTEGTGHLTTPLTDDLSFVNIRHQAG